MLLNKGYCYREVLTRKAETHTVLSYLAHFYTHSSQELWLERLEQGEVLLNDVCAVGSEKLKSGQVLIWNRPPWQEEAVPLHYELVYKDAELLVVNKPSGLPSVAAGGFLENTLLTIVKQDYPEANPLHRLGRGTSGLVLFTRTKDAASTLGQIWNSKVKKSYRALAIGLAMKNNYEIIMPIGHVHHPKLGKIYAATLQGKAAKSYAKVLERRNETTLFSVTLGSGRPHQIRIHLASIGHPLVGDSLYTQGGVPLKENPALPGKGGYYLHAESLRFTHPVSGERLEFHALVPAKLQMSH